MRSKYQKGVDMRTITATELARNLRDVLDRMIADGEPVEIERNHARIACLVPRPARQTALQAMADLYRTLEPGDARVWLDDSRGQQDLDQTLHDPWRS